jgi:L-serine dehydratase
MAISAFDLFKIGMGPSSSHTVGPMRAARLFVQGLAQDGLLTQVAAVGCDLYGSLAATGQGHGTDGAVLLGLMGHAPDTVDVDAVPGYLAQARASQQLALLGQHVVRLAEKNGVRLHRRETWPEHPNGLQFTALDAHGQMLRCGRYLSVGGGFVVTVGAPNAALLSDYKKVPYPFTSGRELLLICKQSGCSISQLMWANERTWRSDADIRTGLDAIWHTMQACVNRGLSASGVLPGPFRVIRRAPLLAARLRERAEQSLADPLSVLDWVNVYALAVNEENAAGGRVVTAPTNGAAGIVPAVLLYCDRFLRPMSGAHAGLGTGAAAQQDQRLALVDEFLLTAAAIGMLYKLNASISGAEVGCQGEVGVACSMAAAGLAAVMGGTPEQVENAAEIGMEHNLGLTCDPVGGLVQVPCIERNAMGAVKAINAARMALAGNGHHLVSLDKVIQTMRQTGADMKTQYKETSRGGLAVNVVEC